MASNSISLHWCTEMENGSTYRFLTKRESLYTSPATLDNTTADDLIEFSENEAEGNNYHDFIGKAEFIYNTVTKHSDTGTAKAVLYDIVASGEFNGN